MTRPGSVALTELPGIGPLRATAFARLGVFSVRDLLLLLPRRHEVAGSWCSIAEAKVLVGELVRVRGKLAKVQSFRSGPRRSTLRFVLDDGAAEIGVTVFNQPWRIPKAREWAVRGEEIALEAKVALHSGEVVLTSPRFEEGAREFGPEGSTTAVYPSTQGLGSALIQRVIGVALERFGATLVEELPSAFRERHGLGELEPAVRKLHAGDGEAADRRRVALESLLVLQAGLLGARRAGGAAWATAASIAAAREHSPHAWTPGQEHAITTLLAELGQERPMRRLLQGDVGSGKTLVAQCVADAVVRAGGQVALMAPTATLAEQHCASLAPWFEARGHSVALVTGSLAGAERRALREGLRSGAIEIAIGTTALVSRNVEFRRLVLGIVDEEQRFGVAQRSALFGREAHALVMTATPIPRSLALTLYGDWDTVRLDGFPPGRGGRRTRVVGPGERERVERHLYERLARGERAFWIVPRIVGEEASIEEAEARLSAGPLAEFGLEVVHGRLPTTVRNARLDRFRDGRSRLLVATTVVEVGVDVPEATLLAVEGAERFGLAQLHQLRGRVGRGAGAAIAIFMAKRGSQGRMRALETTEDGFVIAEEDLRQRGMGELLGRRQSGWSASALEEVVEDADLVAATRELLRSEPAIHARYRRP
ncbi:MAG: helicase-related protein [Planctomycetota bacterium]